MYNFGMVVRLIWCHGAGMMALVQYWYGAGIVSIWVGMVLMLR